MRSYKGLSCMRGNSHVQFLGEPQLVTAVAYPTGFWISCRVFIELWRPRLY